MKSVRFMSVGYDIHESIDMTGQAQAWADCLCLLNGYPLNIYAGLEKALGGYGLTIKMSSKTSNLRRHFRARFLLHTYVMNCPEMAILDTLSFFTSNSCLETDDDLQYSSTYALERRSLLPLMQAK